MCNMSQKCGKTDLKISKNLVKSNIMAIFGN